jgi:hypothetical protein
MPNSPPTSRRHLCTSATDDDCFTKFQSGSSYIFKTNFVAAAMINAVLVFNGQGQPRLTKFYTQLVQLTVSSRNFTH